MIIKNWTGDVGVVYGTSYISCVYNICKWKFIDNCGLIKVIICRRMTNHKSSDLNRKAEVSDRCKIIFIIYSSQHKIVSLASLCIEGCTLTCELYIIMMTCYFRE